MVEHLGFIGTTTTSGDEAAIVNLTELSCVQLAVLANFGRSLIPRNVLDQLARGEIPELKLLFRSP